MNHRYVAVGLHTVQWLAGVGGRLGACRYE